MDTSLGNEKQIALPYFAGTGAPHLPLSPHASSRLGSSTVLLSQRGSQVIMLEEYAQLNLRSEISPQ